MSQYSLTRAADLDLEEILLYIAERNSSAASKMYLRFLSKFAMLGRQPLLGEECPDLRPHLRCFPEGNYVIYYETRDEGIQVVRVLHGMRDVTQILT